METISRNMIKNLLPKRPKDIHKGKAGKLLIIAGSPSMAGAAIISAKSALKSGAGLVHVSLDKELWPVVQSGEPCAICIGREGLNAESLTGYDAIAVGPGLGTGTDEKYIVENLLKNYSGKLILDADALNLIAEHGLLRNKSAAGSRTVPSQPAAKLIITPHPGEAARLLRSTSADINSAREDSVKKLASLCGGIAVLKGFETLISDCANHIWLNPTGNPGMATAGSGDVLTGSICAFAGMGKSPADAAIAGVFVHGLAGDIAAEEIGEYGITAMDIALALPRAIKIIQDS